MLDSTLRNASFEHKFKINQVGPRRDKGLTGFFFDDLDTILVFVFKVIAHAKSVMNLWVNYGLD